MMTSRFDFDQLRNLTIGTVDYVSPNEIKVLLETDAPQNTALNTGVPALFPRINGFVLIPNEVGAVVGVISWLGTEHSQYPKRKGFRDYDLIDLPFPLRKMAINPIGTLKTELVDDEAIYKLERGVYSFPSIGDSVILPKDEQLRSIVENSDEGAFVKIGIAPIAGNATVKINPNKLFGRHVAVLGNTGSGKSCTASGLIRWSLEEASRRRKDHSVKLNSRFIILDPNGEYSECFEGLDSEVKRFKIELSEHEHTNYRQLKVPAWLWNSYEWSAFSQASAKTQRPILRRALRELKNGAKAGEESQAQRIARYFQSVACSLRNDISVGAPAFIDKPGRTDFGKRLKVHVEAANKFIGTSTSEIDGWLAELRTKIHLVAQLKFRSFTPNGATEPVEYFESFSFNDVESVLNAVQAFVEKLGLEISLDGLDEDMPIHFDTSALSTHVEFIAEEKGVLQYLDFLVLRIRTLLADRRMKATIVDDEITLQQWLEDHLTGITVIDLSLIPADVVHIIVAVISRVIFEAIQRYRRKNGSVFPTVLMLEEAHNFIKKYQHSNEDISPTDVCSQTFERIAKEGRKFGLSLMISSQRPSELSDTVLSQCNTFLLHRIVNDRDQDLVKRLVPDNIGGLLKELPILPTRKAILLGWASPLPILVEINPLPDHHCPQSKDPDFWEVWTGERERIANWDEISREWQGRAKVGEAE